MREKEGKYSVKKMEEEWKYAVREKEGKDLVGEKGKNENIQNQSKIFFREGEKKYSIGQV